MVISVALYKMFPALLQKTKLKNRNSRVFKRKQKGNQRAKRIPDSSWRHSWRQGAFFLLSSLRFRNDTSFFPFLVVFTTAACSKVLRGKRRWHVLLPTVSKVNKTLKKIKGRIDVNVSRCYKAFYRSRCSTKMRSNICIYM